MARSALARGTEKVGARGSCGGRTRCLLMHQASRRPASGLRCRLSSGLCHQFLDCGIVCHGNRVRSGSTTDWIAIGRRQGSSQKDTIAQSSEGVHISRRL